MIPTGSTEERVAIGGRARWAGSEIVGRWQVDLMGGMAKGWPGLDIQFPEEDSLPVLMTLEIRVDDRWFERWSGKAVIHSMTIGFDAFISWTWVRPDNLDVPGG
jgi:hypothetical protein